MQTRIGKGDVYSVVNQYAVKALFDKCFVPFLRILLLPLGLFQSRYIAMDYYAAGQDVVRGS